VAPVLGVLSGGLTAAVLHYRQVVKSRSLPFLPSHIEAVDCPDVFTAWYAAMHDLTMCVTEAWNARNARMNDSSVEANLNKERLDACSTAVRENADGVWEALQPYQHAAELYAPAARQLGDTWNYRYHDNYRTETYIATRIDSKGKTHKTTRTRRVYEDTDHWWTFHRASAREAQSSVARTLAEVDEHGLPVPKITARSVDVEALDDVQRMFLRRLVRDTVLEDPKAEVDDTEASVYVNQWLQGGELDLKLAVIRRGLMHTRDQHEERFAHILDGRDHHEKTFTPGPTDGPRSYESCLALKGHLDNAVEAISDVRDLLHDSVTAAKTLQDWATDNTLIEADRDYAETAVALYEQAFPHSALEVDQLTTPGKTALIGLGVGAAVGLVVALAYTVGPL